MKILHVDMGKEWRGGQRQCALLHQGLLARGIQSKLLANSKGELQHKAKQPVQSISFGGELSLAGLVRLFKIIRAERPDIVHSHEAHSLMPLTILRKFMNFHLVHTRRVDFHIKGGFKYKNPQLKLVAISNGVKKVLLEDGVNSQNINVIYSGVPAIARVSGDAVQKLRKELDIAESSQVFGTVANFSPHKDLKTMLSAFKLYQQRDKKAYLMMVGEGPLYEEIRGLAEGMERVIFTGFQANIPLYMSAMDIFLVSSELEGLNTSIIDAMHLGLPVVATNTGGIGELVEDGQTGYLAPTHSPDAFADCMWKLAQDQEKMAEFSESGRRKAAGFTDDAMIEEYVVLYQKLMGER